MSGIFYPFNTSLFNTFSSFSKMSYKILSQSSSDGRDNLNEDIPAIQPLKLISYRHAIFLYILSAALTAALLISIAVRPYTLQNGPFGSYETGYKTEIVMNANALALKKVKFYGGILVSENGTYSLSHEQGTPDYFGPPGSETDHAWGQLVKDRYIGIDPQEWPPEALRPNKGKDLVRDKWWVEPSSLHALHCLNYVRRSFHPEYYTKYQDKSGPPDPEPHTNTHSMHLSKSIPLSHTPEKADTDTSGYERALSGADSPALDVST
ncbi:uncharacterized protein PAC_02400 [Phialocephala subalpina]|uniref:Uncharacterized protein n=1 Tax=Phialocephala subalpina TaxID=576137 RepID=A0A1L7WIC0_9HELO|nr:uncharacterized protein PAC_02400 [Phialocephala subalpina]